MANIKKTFSKIYDQYIDKIYRFIYLKVNSQEIAQDLTSETFLRGWEAFKKANNPTNNDRKIENPAAFLYQIARNLVIDYYREKDKNKTVPLEFQPIIDSRQNPKEDAIQRSEINMIKIALTGLKEEYQNVIIWHYLDDLSIKEVAKMMGRTEQATRVLLHRALTVLKKRFNNIYSS